MFGLVSCIECPGASRHDSTKTTTTATTNARCRQKNGKYVIEGTNAKIDFSTIFHIQQMPQLADRLKSIQWNRSDFTSDWFFSFSFCSHRLFVAYIWPYYLFLQFHFGWHLMVKPLKTNALRITHSLASAHVLSNRCILVSLLRTADFSVFPFLLRYDVVRLGISTLRMHRTMHGNWVECHLFSFARWKDS